MCMSSGGGSKSSQRCFILQTHHKFKLLCREDEQQLVVLKGNMKDTRYTHVAEPDLPVVSGCTESLALVKSAMSFRGPP